MLGLIFSILVFIALLILLSSQFYNIIFRGFAPFISSRPFVIQTVLRELNMKEDAKVYELGCGKAGFLRAIEEKYPRARLVGIENSLWPYLLARLQKVLSKSKMELRKGDLFKADIKDADVIYCYLINTMMPRVGEKVKGECKPGTLIVSYIFSIPGWTPEKDVEVKEKPGEKIHFYRV
jgi:hypothetical protein